MPEGPLPELDRSERYYLVRIGRLVKAELVWEARVKKHFAQETLELTWTQGACGSCLTT